MKRRSKKRRGKSRKTKIKRASGRAVFGGRGGIRLS